MKVSNKRLLVIVVVFIMALLLGMNASAGAKKRGWSKDDYGVRYVYKNGKYVKKSWKTIKRKKYYFNKKGYRVTGWLKLRGKKYYFNAKGVLQKGLLKYKGKKYYLSPETGEMQKGIYKIENSLYYFNHRGQLQTRPGMVKIGEDNYYVQKGGILKTGWFRNKWKTLYFDNYGRQVKNAWINYNGKKYHLNPDGILDKNRWIGEVYVGNDGAEVIDNSKDIEISKGYLTKELLDEMNLTSCYHLMVIAHPDDETLWGGGHLVEGNYFVVCLTDGYNLARKAEFETILKESGNKGIILSYPDLENGIRSDWSRVKKMIRGDLDLLMTYKKWGTVVTHNPSGEYGHIHHKMTSRLVTQSYHKHYWEKRLFYFGRYYKKEDLVKYGYYLTKLPDKNYRKKLWLLNLFPSQKGAVNDSIHMAPYENWKLEQDWT